jgi:hypothetical protein
VLGLTSDALHEAREHGSTLAEVAAAQGVDADDVVAAIVEDKAAERHADAQERAGQRVNGTDDA